MNKTKKEKVNDTLPRLIEDRLMRDDELDFVIGVDEAGRGPLAGPVVAGACVYFAPRKSVISGVKDSKIINEEDRELLYDILSKDNQIIWSVGEIDNHRIDEINILQATFEAMTKAVEGVLLQLKNNGKYKFKSKSPKFHVLIDGNKVPPQLSHYNCTAVIKGDGKEFIIGAASVFAKVTRDRIMYKIDKEFPQYEFGKHKGYGTSFHFNTVYKCGPCKYHRFTFAPIKNMDLDKNGKVKKQQKQESVQKTKKSKKTLKLEQSQMNQTNNRKGLNKSTDKSTDNNDQLSKKRKAAQVQIDVQSIQKTKGIRRSPRFS